VRGEEAFMHLHVVDAQRRRSGLGNVFVRQTAALYFEVLELKRLFCEPMPSTWPPTGRFRPRAFTTSRRT
jgi:hypothetical protein